MTPDPALHLVADGQRIDAVGALPDGGMTFVVVAPVPSLRLCSRSNRPTALGISDDHRCLGYAVTALVVEDAITRREIAIGQLGGEDGFHEAEPEGWCWTDGDAGLPAWLWDGLHGRITLEVHGFALPHYPGDQARLREDRALFNGFTSLGQDCEFGFAQRHFDAEPISLFRWGTTTARQVIAGLERGLEGLGDATHTTLAWLEEASEYRLIDPRYLAAHTWVRGRVDQAEEARLWRDGRARLALLRRKLLHELADPRRIFVHRTTDPAFDRSTMAALNLALRRHGTASLLCVTLPEAGVTDGASAHGAVRDLGDGLFHAALAARGPNDAPDPIWRDLCVRARALHESRC
jgi:hypothetical protein